MHFECCRNSLRALAISEATIQALHDTQRRNKTKTCYRAPFSVHAANKKGEHASTKSQKHNGLVTKRMRCHIMNSRNKNGSSYIPHR